MIVDPTIFSVFGHFQNLNLLVLLDDLRTGRIARGAWFDGEVLCPVAHAMPEGQAVRSLQYLGQAEALGRACDYAAERMGARPRDVERFVEMWDSCGFTREWLIQQLEAMWKERLADADAVQEVLAPAPARCHSSP
jgi:hypothetical protein